MHASRRRGEAVSEVNICAWSVEIDTLAPGSTSRPAHGSTMKSICPSQQPVELGGAFGVPTRRWLG
jgi:hypothetical protein